MPRPTFVTIDLAALTENARLIRSLAGSSQVMAAVKANAYGHGMTLCAKTLEPMVDAFAVAFCEEATQLRVAGIRKPILILEGPFDLQDMIEIANLDCWPVVHSVEQITLLETAISQRKCEPTQIIWLKVDTGMHRLGISPEEVSSATDKLQQLGITDIRLLSHLAHAEAPDASLTQRQLQRWTIAADNFGGQVSLKNSAGLITIADTPRQLQNAEWIRPGYMLYGGAIDARYIESSTNNDRVTHIDTHAVMELCSRIMAIRTISEGETVGYGGRWTATRSSRIATTPVGYGDGYPRTAENGTPVIIEGVRCPLVGRVSMDMITVDVTACTQATIGSPVQLWGPQLSVDEIARHANTIGYELLTRLSERVPRVVRPITTP